MRRKTMGAAVTLVMVALGAGAVIATAGGAGGRSAAASDRPLFAGLSGRDEIGTDGRRNAGDRDGRGAASVLVTSSRICFGIQVNGIDSPVAAHIHRGPVGQNGPIVVPLTAPSSGTNGTSTGCANGTGALRNELKRFPNRFYVNVHTTAFPGGAIRGQLKR